MIGIKATIIRKKTHIMIIPAVIIMTMILLVLAAANASANAAAFL